MRNLQPSLHIPVHWGTGYSASSSGLGRRTLEASAEAWASCRSLAHQETRRLVEKNTTDHEHPLNVHGVSGDFRASVVVFQVELCRRSSLFTSSASTCCAGCCAGWAKQAGPVVRLGHTHPGGPRRLHESAHKNEASHLKTKIEGTGALNFIRSGSPWQPCALGELVVDSVSLQRSPGSRSSSTKPQSSMQSLAGASWDCKASRRLHFPNPSWWDECKKNMAGKHGDHLCNFAGGVMELGAPRHTGFPRSVLQRT